ncbi:hypothetical protein HDU83_002343 [Entophlyctis luteolus]|nr:hypothetical protein HDU82_005520 [Entophlyctis luteolus]KAJ3347183.1 hypothetical protein HDU83_002343 [Entophlyctis luteolus]KAJ3388617.1 hypothetical protein HDU84_009623 [Entophlyctis sp. JEL0112]
MLATTTDALDATAQTAPSLAQPFPSAKELLINAELPEEDNDDPDFEDEEMMEGQNAEDEQSEDNSEDDDDEDGEEIDIQEVNDLNAELAHMGRKVLRSGFKPATGDYRDMTIGSLAADDNSEDDEDYIDVNEADDDDDDSDISNDDDDEIAEEVELDEDEVRAIVVNAPSLPTKDGRVLRDGKEIPAAQSDIDLVARMQELMQRDVK